MPLPMVHMFVTETMFKEKNLEVNAHFLLGSISPDAIHMRENTNREDKRKTHFHLEEDMTVEHIFQSRLLPFIESCRNDAERYWFAKGYAAHVLTDLIWTQTVYQDFTRKITEEQIGNARQLYYSDTDQIDFNFYKNESWRPQYWKLLENSKSFEVLEMIQAEETEKWKIRILHWFGDNAKEPGIEPRYITEKQVRQFVQDTSCRLVNLYEHASFL
ncbi:zinc dependent phospholipase C family protein [Paenibacillus sp. LHD-38]|uniref:zinc dependent phospholipase C family protein n=1 Tax=Paenibacillus sp. LHD-38 TaxID=3072143 RepID=UPI0028109344|nr:zinc dependent phospholipase C family protein [Paenibacillus sp. LHD-38]MDQ8734389.1 zinc dependent phospholipase C family protein [Paenibacillus sp. LHD-38]